jgi:hypothetical protein
MLIASAYKNFCRFQNVIVPAVLSDANRNSRVDKLGADTLGSFPPV